VEGAGQALPALSPPDGYRQGGCPHELGKVVTAIARELVGFIWAIARVVEPVRS